MGIKVRTCFWKVQGVGTGGAAREVLRDAIVLLQAFGKTISSEYVRNLCIADMMWTVMHDDLPAAGFVEECLESSLSVLARRQRTDARATTVGDFSDVYNHLITAYWGGVL